METKQAIVWRNDLRTRSGQKVRTGKIAAQVAHASFLVFAERLIEIKKSGHGAELRAFLDLDAEIVKDWFSGSFAKIVLKVESEEELLQIYENARQRGMLCALVRDAGLTEFGEPKFTCCAIGPDRRENVDLVTGHLELM